MTKLDRESDGRVVKETNPSVKELLGGEWKNRFDKTLVWKYREQMNNQPLSGTVKQRPPVITDADGMGPGPIVFNDPKRIK